MASRPKRWHAAIEIARGAVTDLEELRDEYQEWLDNIPEGLEDSPVAEKLQEVVDLDLDQITDALDEFENAELPLGFGRD
jgi:hypothetical protein